MQPRHPYLGFMIVVTILSGAIMMQGCGSTSEATAPFGSAITINPTTSSITGAGVAPACSGIWVDIPFKITVLDPDGQPMNKASITIDLSWSPNSTHPDLWRTELYDGDPGTGAPVTVPYQTTTGSYGVKTVTVRVDSTCPFSGGQLVVMSGTAYAKADLSVQ